MSDHDNPTDLPALDATEPADVESLRAALAEARAKIENLTTALESSRRISAAMGVLMAAHRVTLEGAFELMKAVSQHTHRKLRDVAEEVLYTGALPVPHGVEARATRES